VSGVGVEEGVGTVELVGVVSVELVGVDSVGSVELVGVNSVELLGVDSVELVGSVELDVGVMGFGVVGSVIDIFTATKSMEDFSGTASFSVA
jgi:hypothetical protein